MKQVPTDKYTIAFFRLAEYVSRGEKERALGVYRILSHSFDDPAYACQLEGDILLSFNDEGAQEKYLQAAQLYQKGMRLRQAVGVYEHLTTLNPQCALYFNSLIDLYCQLNMHAKAALYIAKIIDLATSHANISHISQALCTYGHLLAHAQGVSAHERLVYSMIKLKYSNEELIHEHIKRVIRDQSSQDLSHFMKVLNVLDPKFYLFAHNYQKARC
jgi:tetratricopeptide (TPR) repeat protein